MVAYNTLDRENTYEDEARFGQQDTSGRTWDEAGLHRSGEIVVAADISAVELPAYSPELNQVENLWLYLRSHCWSDCSYDGCDD